MQNFQLPPLVERSFIGYNDALPLQDLQPGQFAKADNVLLSDYKISKVTGSSSIAPSIAAQKFQGLAELEILSSSSKFIVAVLNGVTNATWYSWAGSGSFAKITGSDVNTNDLPWFFETANNILFGFDGTECGIWDGTTFTQNPTSVPLGFYPAWFHNYLFVARTKSFPNRLFWSKLGDPKTFAGGIATFSVNSGGSGYSVGDILDVIGGGGVNAQFVVATVTGSQVATVSLLNAGSGYSVTTGAATSEAISGALGAGCTINILTIDSSTVNNFVDINPGDGDLIQGLGIIQDELLVFKRNTIWSITGFSGTSFTSTTINTQNTNNRIIGYGCIAPGSIVSTGNDVYFLSFLGQIPHFRSLKKTQFATTLGGGIISYDIQGTMQNINLQALSTVQGIFDGRYIRWAIPTGNSATPNQVVVYDTFNLQKVRGKYLYPWTTRSGINPTYFVISTISGVANAYFVNSGTDGLVNKFDSSVYTDNGTPISMTVQSRGYMRDPARKMKHKYVNIKYDTGVTATLKVLAQKDNEGFVTQQNVSLASVGGFTLDTDFLDSNATLGGATSSSTLVHLSSVTGRIVQIGFTETSANPVTLYDYELYSIPKGLRS